MENQLSKNVKGRFLEYMSQGVEESIKNNRANLENCIRNEINIDKAKEIIGKYKFHDNNIRIAPESFFTLSLINELPNSVDFRFLPTYNLNGVVFKCLNPVTKEVYSKNVAYREEICELLKLQITPNIELESQKSATHLEILKRRMELFDNSFRHVMGVFQKKVYSRIAYNRNIGLESSFLKNASICYINTENKMSDRVGIKNFTNDLIHPFCEAIVTIIDAQSQYENSVQIVFSVIFKKAFPKLPKSSIDQLVKIIINIDDSINYNDFYNTINPYQKIPREIYKLLKLYEYRRINFKDYTADLELQQKALGKLDDEYKKRSSAFIEIIRKYTQEHKQAKRLSERKRKVDPEEIKSAKAEIESAEVEIESVKRLLELETIKYRKKATSVRERIAAVRRKVAKEGYATRYKDDNMVSISIKKVLKSIDDKDFKVRNKGSIKESVSIHNFINIISLIRIVRRELKAIARKNGPDSAISDTKRLYDKCNTILACHKLKVLSENTEAAKGSLDAIYPSFLETINDKNIHRVIKDRGIDISLKYVSELLKERVLRDVFAGVKKYKDSIGEKRENTPEWDNLMKKNSILNNICESSDALKIPSNINVLREVVTNKDISTVSSVCTANILNILFKGDVRDGFFNSVDYILLHSNMILVMVDDRLISINPSESYKQFVLTKVNHGGIILEEDFDNIQLNRFRSVLDVVFKEKTAEYFSSESGNIFINKLQDSTGVKFLDGYRAKTNNIEEEHQLSWGSLSESEQTNFSRFLNIYSFIFPKKISEINLFINRGRKKDEQIPTDRKEFLFFIEKQRDYNSLITEFRITLNDILLLGIEDGFYHTILIERAFIVIFNKDISGDVNILNEFKRAVGQQNINIALQHFKFKGRVLTESQILRRIFAENCMWLIQNEKEKLSEQMVIFLGSIFKQNIQIAEGVSVKR
jgi:hypothetical protein